MKDSESSKRSGKKTNGRTGSKNSSPQSQAKSNGISKTKSPPKKKTTKATTKSVMGATNSTNNNNHASKSSESLIDKNSSANKNATSSPGKTKTSPRRAGKNSAELRPRRRASQTYFFKYQLARNPLKAEEDDLKMALLASLEQCGSSTGPTDDDSQESQISVESSKNKKKVSQSLLKPPANQTGKRPVGRPPKTTSNHTIVNGLDKAGNRIVKGATKKGGQSQIPSESHKPTATNSKTAHKRRDSTGSSSSSNSTDVKEEARRKKREYDRRRRRGGLLANNLKSSIQSHDDKINITDSRGKVKGSLSSCNDLKSVQNKIKKAKKLLQDKETNKGSNAIIGKFKALRKFPSKSNSPMSPATKRRGSSLLSSPINKNRAEKSGSKNKKRPISDFYINSNSSTQNSANSTSKNQYLMSYLPYTTWEKKDPPDEDYLKKYKPETEDFLTFICFRKTAPNYQPKTISLISSNSQDETNSCTNSNPFPIHNSNNNNTVYADDNNSNSTIIANNNNNNVSFNDRNNSDKLMSDNKLQCNSASIKASNLNSSPIITTNDHLISVNRRPTRQSPRLANSNKKISENDSSSQIIGNTPATAYENSITYEEDMKRASIALEDMAQEINSSDDIHNEIAQNTPDCVSRTSSPFKHNKHLVKGLMTREFAGAFADEDTIFESISNHKL